VQTPAIRERMVSGLIHVDQALAAAVADGLGIRRMPAPMPKVLEHDVEPEVTRSPGLSLMARPGSEGINTRRVAILVADGADGDVLRALYDGLFKRGAVPRFVGMKLGAVDAGSALEVDVPVDAMPSVLFDAVIVAGGAAGATLAADGRMVEFVRDQFRHCKTILALGTGAQVLRKAGVPANKADAGLIEGEGATADLLTRFEQALSQHRHFARETNSPIV